MATKVIDKLIVELGLDPTKFTKGQKEAAAALTKTEKDTEKSSNGMVRSLRKVTAEFVGLFLAVRSLKDVVGYMQNLNESTRQLGIDARNTGESAATLKDLGNAMEIAGGKADDATTTVLGLQKAIYDVQHTGKWADQLTEYQRLPTPVDVGATTGQMRPIVDILRDVSKSLEVLSPAERFQRTQSLGLPIGAANLVTQGQAYFGRQVSIQQGIPQVTAGQTRAAQNVTESYDVLKQRIEAVARQVLTEITPALEKLFRGIGDFIQKHTKDISKGIEDLLGWFAGDGPQKVVDALVALGDAAMTVAETLGYIRHPTKAVNDIVSATTSPTGFMGSEFGKWLHNATADAGYSLKQMKAERANHLPEGLLSYHGLPQDVDPNQLASDLAKIHAKQGGDKGDPEWRKSIDWFNQHVKYATPQLWDKNFDWLGANPQAASAVAGARPSPLAQATADRTSPTADTGTRGGVSVSIRELNVHTQASDAEGIASSIDGALNRKLTVSLFDGALA